MVDSYPEAKVIMSKANGELLLALPIYADVHKSLFSPKDVEVTLDVKNIGIGVYEHFGYLVYHPSQSFSFYLQSLDLFEDLGELGKELNDQV